MGWIILRGNFTDRLMQGILDPPILVEQAQKKNPVLHSRTPLTLCVQCFKHPENLGDFAGLILTSVELGTNRMVSILLLNHLTNDSSVYLQDLLGRFAATLKRHSHWTNNSSVHLQDLLGRFAATLKRHSHWVAPAPAARWWSPPRAPLWGPRCMTLHHRRWNRRSPQV